MVKKVTEEVQSLYYDELGITEPSEIDLEAVAFYKDAIVKEERLTGCEARIIGVGDKAIITVNSISTAERKRFSIGHELGHWFKDRGKIGNLCKHSDMDLSNNNLGHREVIANSFASELLMPSYLMKQSLRELPLTLDTISFVKESYKSSFIAALRRTIAMEIHLGFFAIYDSQGRRVLFSHNNVLPYSFMPPREAPLGSAVHDLLSGKSTDQSAKLMDGDIWCKDNSADSAVVHEHAFHYHDGQYITLVWWEDEEPVWKSIDEKES